MKHTRLFTALVSLCLILVLLPVMAKADTEIGGTFGTGLTWSFNEATGKLIISGKGRMPENWMPHEIPWDPYTDQVRSVEIGNGVANIGDTAFSVMKNLTSVKMADSVTQIGLSAFSGCTSLKSVTFSKNLVKIGSGAFMDTALVSVTLPDGLQVLEGMAFSGCGKLASVTLPQSLGYIESNVFAYCHALTTVNLPKNLTAVGMYAFHDCTALKKITLPATVTYVSDYAFAKCSGLEVFFQGDAPNMKEKAFFNATATVYYPAGNDTWTQDVRSSNYGGSINWESYTCNVQKTMSWSLDKTTGVLTISGTGNIPSYSAVQSVAPWFDDVDSIRSVVIEDGITGIGANAFWSCYHLESVQIPDSVTFIGERAFNQCTALQSVTIPNGVSYIGEWAFNSCVGLQRVTLPQGISTIEQSVFGGCSKLTAIAIPATVEYIGKSAFSNCTALTQLKIPASVSWIGEGAFMGCTGIGTLTIESGVEYLDHTVFYGCTSLTDVTLPDTIHTIGVSAFGGCTGLKTIKLPHSLSVINHQMFTGCTSLTQVTIPGSVTTICDRAFGNCPRLSQITIPEHVTFLGKNLFSGTTNNKTITFTGSAPTMDAATFGGAVITARYPNGYAGWSSAVKQSYMDATITWSPYDKPLADVKMTKAVAHRTGNIIYWEKVPGAQLYQVYRRAGSETAWTLLKNTGSLAYKDTSAAVGVKCYYKVVARSGELKSSMSISAVSAVRPYPLDTVNITKGIAHATGNIVYWDAVDGADLYQVFRRVDGENTWTLVTNTRSLGYKDESAAVGVKYYYKVRARNGSDMSSMSGTAAALKRPYPLADVKMDKAIGHATGNIIYWNAVENAKLYQVYRLRAGETTWTLLKNTGSLAYKDTTAEVGVKYYYKVVARNGEMRSSMDIPGVSAVRP